MYLDKEDYRVFLSKLTLEKMFDHSEAKEVIFLNDAFTLLDDEELIVVKNRLKKAEYLRDVPEQALSGPGEVDLLMSLMKRLVKITLHRRDVNESIVHQVDDSDLGQTVIQQSSTNIG